MNKKMIFSAIGILVAVVIILIIVLVSCKSGIGPEAPNSSGTESSQQVVNIDDPQDAVNSPAITPPAGEDDPTSGSDIVLTPEQRPATDTDLPVGTTPPPAVTEMQ